MFKVLILQALYTLSDEQTEYQYQLKDRLSFLRFVGLALDESVPDATTIWLFRERLVRAGAVERPFARFDARGLGRYRLPLGGQPRVARPPRPRRSPAALEARGRPMPRHVARDNATRGKVRAAIEHVFAAQKRRSGAFVRTVGLARARAKIGLANLACNLTRFAWLDTRPLPASAPAPD